MSRTRNPPSAHPAAPRPLEKKGPADFPDGKKFSVSMSMNPVGVLKKMNLDYPEAVKSCIGDMFMMGVVAGVDIKPLEEIVREIFGSAPSGVPLDNNMSVFPEEAGAFTQKGGSPFDKYIEAKGIKINTPEHLVLEVLRINPWIVRINRDSKLQAEMINWVLARLGREIEPRFIVEVLGRLEGPKGAIHRLLLEKGVERATLKRAEFGRAVFYVLNLAQIVRPEFQEDDLEKQVGLVREVLEYSGYEHAMSHAKIEGEFRVLSDEAKEKKLKDAISKAKTIAKNEYGKKKSCAQGFYKKKGNRWHFSSPVL
jgi:hypothetical protein